ncbi:MAG: spore maturation protein [Lactobacillus sp.]|jgi:spore maturation protein SpmA|nr:spore maturation protein [Lactobacillus sp.]
MLNFIWVAFFISAFLAAVYQTIFVGSTEVWTEIIGATFVSAKTAFTVSINLTGILCLWIGLLKIAEASGLTNMLAKALSPLFKRIMPEIPANHPSLSSMIMNIAANMLGLDNAATPMGIKAMEQMQELNKSKDTASNSQIMFMVINSSAVTIIPITILMYRAEFGSVNPTAVFIPILLATSISTLCGFLSVAAIQRINIFNKVVMAYLLGFAAFIGLVIYGFNSMEPAERMRYSADFGNFILFGIMIGFIISGVVKKINVYETFIAGAKEGFEIAVRIIPYLVAMLVAIGVLRASGALDLVLLWLEKAIAFFGFSTDYVAALPTAIMKPLSGSGARAMMIETFQNYGVDSFSSFVASVVQGSTETTFYVLAVYFGAVKITKIRHALGCSLFADAVGITLAIVFARMFF